MSGHAGYGAPGGRLVPQRGLAQQRVRRDLAQVVRVDGPAAPAPPVFFSLK